MQQHLGGPTTLSERPDQIHQDAAALSRAPLYAGPDQPARRGFDIEELTLAGERIPVSARDTPLMPFCVLTELARSDRQALPPVLIVAPLSGHFAILMRDVVIGLLPYFRVYITDWINARHVPAAHPFSLNANIACVLSALEHVGPGTSIIALCQAGVPALAATALLARAAHRHCPYALVLMAAPIDPLASPTPVVHSLRERPLSWFEEHVLAHVSRAFPGKGRLVYPAHLQLTALCAYLSRHVAQGTDLAAKLTDDDGADPQRFPFLDLYTSIMDLDAQYFLENTRVLYHECALRNGLLTYCGEPIDLRAVQRSKLVTVEAEWDDIAAPGQTSAAHDLCSSLPAGARGRLVAPRSGHFALFHGRVWRDIVLPRVLEHLEPGCEPGLNGSC